MIVDCDVVEVYESESVDVMSASVDVVALAPDELSVFEPVADQVSVGVSSFVVVELGRLVDIDFGLPIDCKNGSGGVWVYTLYEDAILRIRIGTEDVEIATNASDFSIDGSDWSTPAARESLNYVAV